MSKKKPVLVVMAAGLGSRFGGLKQITAVDDKGHALMDYAIYDAKKAGFGEIVFIIRKEFEEQFKETVGVKTAKLGLPIHYVYQQLDMLPEGVSIPADREKPWGTTHAIWCCREVLAGRDFLTINADDFYGYESLELAAKFFAAEDADENEYAIIGYDVVKTLSEHGTVSRGICKVDENGNLIRIDERKEIKLENGCGYFTLDKGETYEKIPAEDVASMNMWAFRAGFVKDISETFPERLKKGVVENPVKFEETLSDAVQAIMDRKACSVKIIPTPERWFGMTYKEDVPMVKARLQELVEEGQYPKENW